MGMKGAAVRLLARRIEHNGIYRLWLVPSRSPRAFVYELEFSRFDGWTHTQGGWQNSVCCVLPREGASALLRIPAKSGGFEVMR